MTPEEAMAELVAESERLGLYLDPDELSAWFQAQEDSMRPAQIAALAIVTMITPYVVAYAVLRHLWRRR